MANQASITRRFFLKATGAVSTAVLPAAVMAQPVELSDDERLDMCIAELREILAQMHPTAGKFGVHHDRRADGSFRLELRGDVEFRPFEGDGIYLVSLQGWVWEYLVREEPVVSLSGRHMGYSHYIGRARDTEGGWSPREEWVNNFIRKIGPGPLNA